MKPFRSLRLRITLLCALLLTLCCAALAVTSNLSAIHLTDTIAAAPLSPALDPRRPRKGLCLSLPHRQLQWSSRPSSYFRSRVFWPLP